MAPALATYEPRDPSRTVLYTVIADQRVGNSKALLCRATEGSLKNHGLFSWHGVLCHNNPFMTAYPGYAFMRTPNQERLVDGRFPRCSEALVETVMLLFLCACLVTPPYPRVAASSSHCHNTQSHAGGNHAHLAYPSPPLHSIFIYASLRPCSLRRRRWGRPLQGRRFVSPDRTVFWAFGCWLRRWDYSRPLASEPDVKVSLHPAQAWNNAPGCVCDTALTGRGFDTVRPLA